ncbi:MAG TPA: VIT1/CCC1 transporter family protein, partial [Solirubrobacterales bacterium]|nr:VIT1/CCC1 transporter family protein [Solirubrobacterales bacterium]
VGIFGSSVRIVACVVVTLLALAGLGTLGARLGGAPEMPALIRVVFWGAVAMAATSVIGVLVGSVV